MSSNHAEIPPTMKAWVAFGAGKAADVLQFQPAWPTPPPPGAGEIAIRVSYVSVNPGDAKMLAKPIPFRTPAVAGMDFAGEVVRVGPPLPSSSSSLPSSSSSSSPSSSLSSSQPPHPGVMVAGTVPMPAIMRGAAGSLAEYLVVPAHAAVPVPHGLDLGDDRAAAAAGLLGIVGQTSVVLLRVAVAAGLREGDHVLLNGASGGVGCVLTQMLRGMGVRVTGVCSGRNVALVRRLGAEVVVDYTAHNDLYAHLSSLATSPGNSRPFDAIFDCVGDDALYYRSPGYLKADGRFHSIEKGPLGFISQFKFNHWPVLLGGVPRTYSSVFSKPAGSSGREVVEWFERGCIKEFPIASVFEMEDALKAFEMSATKRTVGKILIRVNKEAR